MEPPRVAIATSNELLQDTKVANSLSKTQLRKSQVEISLQSISINKQRSIAQDRTGRCGGVRRAKAQHLNGHGATTPAEKTTKQGNGHLGHNLGVASAMAAEHHDSKADLFVPGQPQDGLLSSLVWSVRRRRQEKGHGGRQGNTWVRPALCGSGNGHFNHPLQTSNKETAILRISGSSPSWLAQGP